jgi:hypothetical protein
MSAACGGDDTAAAAIWMRSTPPSSNGPTRASPSRSADRASAGSAETPLFGPVSIAFQRKHERQAARPPISIFSPLATILSASSGRGLCSLRASPAGAFIQTSMSSGVVRTTGIAFGWIAPTSLFGSVVRKAKMSFVVSPSLTFRTDAQRVQMPAKNAKGRVSSKANQTGGWEPSGSTSFSEKLVKGTPQRFSIPSQRRQCGDVTLRTLVTPGSDFFPLRAR